MLKYQPLKTVNGPKILFTIWTKLFFPKRERLYSVILEYSESSYKPLHPS